MAARAEATRLVESDRSVNDLNMGTLEYRTAGESHGQALIALIEGLPAGVTLDITAANRELVRRQGGYGRGGRQRIEKDEVNILSGVRRGKTIGSPVAIQIANKVTALTPTMDQPIERRRRAVRGPCRIVPAMTPCTTRVARP